MRDKSKTFTRYIFAFLSLGWRSSAKHWHRYETASLILAGLSTPSGALGSLDRVLRLCDGPDSRLAYDDFPPYFVAGAVFAGFAMVLTLAIPVRKWYGLEDFITDRHLDNMAKVMFATGMIVCYGYFLEVFMAWYSANEYEWAMLMNRATGPYKHLYWALLDLQRPVDSSSLVAARAAQHHDSVHREPVRQRRHVARALRDHPDVTASRLYPVVVGHVHSDVYRLGDVPRHDGSVHFHDVPVHSGAADDLDV
jgi:hypothetical protein